MTDTTSVVDSKDERYSTTDTFVNLLANLGTSRDKASYANFSGGAYGNTSFNALSNVGNLNYQKVELESMYSTNWLSGKVVDAPVNAMLRGWREVSFGSQEELHKIYVDAEKEFSVKEQFRAAMKWARLYGGSAIIMGINGAGDSSMPLDLNRVQKGSLQYLQNLDRWHLSPEGINFTDITKESFTKPEYYRIAYTNQLVHHSRCIVFSGHEAPLDVANRLNFWGQSILERMYSALIDAATASSVTNSLLYEAVTETISIENLIDILASKGGTERLLKRFGVSKLMQSINNVRLLDSKDTYHRDQLQFEQLPELIRETLQIVSGASGIPVAVLIGRATSGLNSTGETDVRNWYDDLAAKQEYELAPGLDRLDEVLLRTTFGGVPEDYDWHFRPLWQSSDSEQADIELKNAQRDSIHYQDGIVTPAMIAKNLQRDEVYQISDEYIDALEESFSEEDLKTQQLGEPETVAFATQTKVPKPLDNQ